MMKKRSGMKRALAFVLAFAMVCGYLPANIFAADSALIGQVTTVSDPDTVSRPVDVYGDNTLNAGKVTVGKSVSDSDVTLSYGDTSHTFTPDENNFIVTVSQTAQVVGLASESKIPLDVVFVLDTSGSMNENGVNRAASMVDAANSAIATLMEANAYNRVAVVAFSSRNYGEGTSNDAAANVLSSLAHYTGDAATNHLTWVNDEGSTTGNNRRNIAGRDTATITIEGEGRWDPDRTVTVNAFRRGYNGGTNIQAGIITGAKLLTADTNTTTVTTENGTVTRMPVLVVLSDGQPTFSYSDSNWYDPSSTNEQGPGNDPYAGNGFLPALAAAYYKGAITEKYYGDNASEDNRCLIYTIGVQLTEDLAEMTLNPDEHFVTGSTNSYYSTFNTYWNNYSAATPANFNITVNNNQNYQVTADSITASTAYVNGISSSGKTMYDGGLDYNDDYFAATDTADIANAFQNVVTSIQKKAMASPTHVDATYGEDFSGYVTFTDPIGEFMEVKEMYGVLANGYWYRGKTFAQYLQNWSTAPQEFKDLFVQTLQQRGNLSGSTIDVESFIAQAAASPNQAYYNSDTDYDNSIVWWGDILADSGEEDEQVRMIGFADNDTIDYITDSSTVIPEGADYVCRSYYFYGTAGNTVANPNHEYLYFMVRVQRSLTAPYQQTVVVSAPASLLSVEKVLITESEDAQGNPVYTAEVTEAEPARVVYEVGLQEGINEYTVEQILADYPEHLNETATFDGQSVNTNYNAATGEYTFYTNDWHRSAAENSHERAGATATFDASADNAFYTYQEDTLIYVKEGDSYVPYTGTGSPVGSGFYYAREVYDWSGTTADEEGKYTATMRIEYIPVSIPSGMTAEQIKSVDGQWYIAKGLYKASSLTGGEDVYKSENRTQTSEVVAHPHRTVSASNSHYTVYLGNNGKLTLKSKDAKTVEDAQGNDIDGEIIVVGDVLTYKVEAKNNEASAATIVITDKVPAGTEYVADSADNGGVYDAATGTITWTIENVASGATVNVSFKVTVTSAAVDTVNNTATIQVGDDPAYETNTTVNPPVGKDSSADVTVEGDIQVGSVITYTIYYFNNEATTAAVTITDTVPAGTSYVADSATSGGVYDADTNTVTWTLSSVPAGASGTVSFRVHVGAGAVSVNPDGDDVITNTATIQVGNNPVIETNTTEDELGYGDLVLTKTVVDGNAEGDKDKYFTLVLYSGVEGVSVLNGTFAVTGSSKVSSVTFENGYAYLEIKHGETVTVVDLPGGVTVDVYEQVPGGYTVAYSADNQKIVINSTVRIDVTNTYNVIPVVINPYSTKVLEGRELEDKEFSFVVYEFYGTDGQTIVSTGENAADGTVAFKPITYTKAGTHVYTVVEVNSGLAGVTYDTTVYTVTVVVTDNGDGTLSAQAQSITYVNADGETVTVDDDVFTNVYQAADTSVTLEGTKALIGRTLKDAEFSFIVTDTDGNVVTTGENETDGTITFKPITFTAAGTYEYTISEVKSGLNGITYDETTFTVTVTVVDDGEGQLVASVSYSAPIAFSNTYDAADTSVTLEGTKTLTGRTLKDGEFSFIVTDKDGNVVTTGENEADGTITFKPITYTAAGTYEYTVSEVNSGLNGVTYDTAAYTVTVTVVDNGEGQLVASVSYSAPVAFSNSYRAADTSITLEGTKALTGRTLRDGEFSFIVTDKDGNVVTTGENETDGTITFKPITFTAAGTYEYTISEVKSGLNGITYDETTFTVTVTVVDNGEGQLVATASYSAPVAFSNGYTAAETDITLTGTKVLTGRTLKDGEFSFIVTDKDGNVVTTGENEADGTITFKPITFTAAGVYTYTISEVNSGLNGITYDAATYTATVTVVDNGEGNLVATVTYSGTVRFTNSYEPDQVSVTLEGTKTLTGSAADGLTEGEFSFSIYTSDSQGTQGSLISSGFNGAGTSSADITFASIGFTLADMKDASGNILASKDFYFLIAEDIPASDGPTFDPNMYYDQTQYLVKVTVSYDVNTGVLTVGTPVYTNLTTDAAASDAAFTNIQNPDSVEVTPVGTKTTTNAPEGITFSFSVVDTATGIEAGAGVGDANGNITFTTLSFSDPGTYVYDIKESNAGNTTNGITYDDAVYTMTVVVTRDATNKLVAAVTYTENGNAVTTPSFHNTYDAAGYINITAAKVLEGRALKAGEFAFKLIRQDNGGEIDGIVAADGTVTFATMYYGIEDLNGQDKVTIHYVMSEVIPGTAKLPGVTYDASEHDVYVTIVDNNDGTISAYLSDKDGNALSSATNTGITFTNTYVPTGGTDVTMEVTKTLTGRALEDGEFVFALYRYHEADGTWLNIGAAFNDANGKVSFTRTYNASTLSHHAFEDGKFTVIYRIDEVNNNLGGVSYATNSVYVKVVVSHDEDTASYSAEVEGYYANAACTEKLTNPGFTNTYEADDTSVTPEGTKTLTGRTMADNEFSFVVTDKDGNVVSTGLSKKDGTIAFTPIGFSEAGTYQYTISEVKGNLGGMSYDETTYTMTVTVTDDGEGNLVASVTYSGTVVFSNSYSAADTSVTLTGTKVLTGRTMADNEFSFVVTDKDGNVVSTGLSKADGTIAFTPIGYTEAGTYEYTISEVKGNLGGVTYDETTYTVTVTVTDDGEGNLVASVTYSAPVAFSNTYRAADVSATLEGTKVLTGRVMADNEFSFIVTDKDGNVVSTGLSKADGTIAFTPIGYTAAGTYTYTVSEVKGNLNGVTYTDAVYTVTVTVVDDTANGKLVATVTYPEGGLTFTNDYKAQDTSVTLVGTKVLRGREMTDNEFSFLVTDEDGNVVSTGLSKADGTIAFTPIGYVDGQEGTYTYTISEVKGNLGGVTYTEVIYKAVVVVSDNDTLGTLEATVTYFDANLEPIQANAVVFTNTYTLQGTTYTPVATKVLTGRTMEDNEFSFVVTDKDGNVVSTGLSKANGTVAFTPIGYTAEGTHEYTVSEVKGNLGGVTYTDAVYTITVTVEDDGQGNLVATGMSSGSLVFTNTYDSAPAEVSLHAHKTLDGKNLAEDEFSFRLKDASGNVLQTVPNDGSGTVSFGAIRYTEPGTYIYTISEVIGTEVGYTYDETVYTVVVEVVDNGSGNLIASYRLYRNYGEADQIEVGAAAFYNSYVAPPITLDLNDTIDFSKTATSTAGTAVSKAGYKFEVYNWNGELVSSGTSDENGNIDFEPDLEFAIAGDYRFAVKEIPGTTEGMVYDANTWEIHVVVTYDNDTGLLSVSEVITHVLNDQNDHTDAGADVDFVNVYDPTDAKLAIEMDKTFSGRELTAGAFTFQLFDENGQKIGQTTNDAGGNVVFSLTFDKVGTYTYTVKEVNDGQPGVTYDDTARVVTIKVEDVGGTLVATYSISGGNGSTFQNAYITSPAKVNLSAEKILNGRPLKAGEFEFVLTDAEGNEIKATNNADGSITFETIEYTEAGTYTYTLTETNNGLGGVTYDETTYTVTVQVVDNGEGALIAAVTYTYTDSNGSEQVIDVPTFINTYSAAPTSVAMEATKSLSGRELNEGEFEFVLTDAEGNEIKATNNADGSITFETIGYTEPGTYVYTLTETNNGVGGVTYDETTYTVTVKAVDDGEGNLVASVYVNNTEIQAGEDGVHDLATFYNSYAPDAVFAYLEVTKELTGRELKDGEFEFVLTDAEGNVVLATNNAAGLAAFNAIAYTETGTYTYTLTETKGTLGGVTYDSTTYAVVVEVKDDLKGNLYVASVTVDGEPVLQGEDGRYMLATFHNTYAPETLDVMLAADKTLNGRDLKAGEFAFTLTDAEGNIVRAVNEADGTVIFRLSYEQAGTYTYTLRESRGSDNEIVYDTSTYTVVITVADDGEGSLYVASATVDGKPVQIRSLIIETGVEFVNKYEEPKTPDTGDEMPLTLMVSVMFLSAAALAVLLLGKKRRA